MYGGSDEQISSIAQNSDLMIVLVCAQLNRAIRQVKCDIFTDSLT